MRYLRTSQYYIDFNQLSRIFWNRQRLNLSTTNKWTGFTKKVDLDYYPLYSICIAYPSFERQRGMDGRPGTAGGTVLTLELMVLFRIKMNSIPYKHKEWTEFKIPITIL